MALSLNNLWVIVTINVLAVGVLMTWYTYAFPSVITDNASSRSMHQGKAVTGGGFLMFLPLCLSLLWLNPSYYPAYLLFAMSLLGLADDKFDVSFKLRLLIQACIVVLSLVYFQFTFGLVFMLLLFSCMWWVNLFNFMDGANGMAGLHTLVILLFYALTVQQIEVNETMIVTMAAVTGVYLIFNLYLKKLFMGDSGSLPMALMLAIIAFYALKNEWLNVLQVAVIHAVFIADATLTLLVRLKAGENITKAHASHLYQRLIKNKQSHLKVSLAYALVTVLLCMVAFFMSLLSILAQFLLVVVCYLALILIFMKYFRTGR